MDFISEIVSLSVRDGCELGVEKKYEDDENSRKFLKSKNLEGSKMNSVRLKL